MSKDMLLRAWLQELKISLPNFIFYVKYGCQWNANTTDNSKMSALEYPIRSIEQVLFFNDEYSYVIAI